MRTHTFSSIIRALSVLNSFTSQQIWADVLTTRTDSSGSARQPLECAARRAPAATGGWVRASTKVTELSIAVRAPPSADSGAYGLPLRGASACAYFARGLAPDVGPLRRNLRGRDSGAHSIYAHVQTVRNRVVGVAVHRHDARVRFCVARARVCVSRYISQRIYLPNKHYISISSSLSAPHISTSTHTSRPKSNIYARHTRHRGLLMLMKNPCTNPPHHRSRHTFDDLSPIRSLCVYLLGT